MAMMNCSNIYTILLAVIILLAIMIAVFSGFILYISVKTYLKKKRTEVGTAAATGDAAVPAAHNQYCNVNKYGDSADSSSHGGGHDRNDNNDNNTKAKKTQAAGINNDVAADEPGGMVGTKAETNPEAPQQESQTLLENDETAIPSAPLLYITQQSRHSPPGLTAAAATTTTTTTTTNNNIGLASEEILPSPSPSPPPLLPPNDSKLLKIPYKNNGGHRNHHHHPLTINILKEEDKESNIQIQPAINNKVYIKK